MLPSPLIFRDFFSFNTIPQILVEAESALIIQANDAACVYYGLALCPEAPMYLYDFDVHHSAVTLAELNLAANGIEQTIKSTHRTTRGIREVEIHTCAVPSGARTIILATIYDITDQNIRERAVSADEERWHFALSGNGDGVWDWDITSNESFCTLRWHEMLGYGRFEIGGDLRSWLQLVCEDDRGRVTAAYDRILAGEVSRMELEYRMLRKNGDPVWVLDRCTVLRWDTDGLPVRIISVHSDISAHKKNEAELRYFNETLERVVEQRTEALNLELSVRHETERRLLAFQERLAASTEELCRTEERERRTLATWLHDDIGQNLALLKIHLDRLGQNSPDGRDSFQELSALLAATIGEIRERTIQISPPLLESLGLAPAIAKLAHDMGEMHGFTVRIDEPQVMPELSRSVRSTLYRIVRELIVNIVKHADAHTVTIVSTYDGEYVGISVMDDGRGFDLAQLEATVSANSSFGLFHVRQRITLLGGGLNVYTAPGEGSVCSIRIPVIACEPGERSGTL